jgi:hypothetical protein
VGDDHTRGPGIEAAETELVGEDEVGGMMLEFVEEQSLAVCKGSVVVLHPLEGEIGGGVYEGSGGSSR